MQILYFSIFIYYFYKSFFYFFYYTKSQNILFFNFNINFNINFTHSYDNDIVLVSSYYPLTHSKHSHSTYNFWIKSFLNIINCKIIIYTTLSFYNAFFKKELFNISKKRYHFFNFNFTFPDIFDVPCLKNLSKAYQKIHDIDREKKIHNPYLYAIWNGKICFLREATLIYPNHSFFFWVDSGCVRDFIYQSLFDNYGNICSNSKYSLNQNCDYLHFPTASFSKDIFRFYNNPPLEVCLFFISNHIFSVYSNRTINDISEGIFFGSKIGIYKFYKAFWKTHNEWLKNNIFCGKDQEIYNYVFSHFFNQINFYIFPAFNASEKGNKWFRFLSAFSKENPYNVSKILLPYNFFFRS